MSPFQDLADYIVANMPAETILQFRASKKLHDYTYALLEKEKVGTATAEEKKELDECMVVEHIVRLMKAKAWQKTNQ